jgi:hypothetical protein
MRLLPAAIFVAVSAAAGAAELQDSAAMSGAPAPGSANCPRTTGYLADQSGLHRGQPLKPRKLTELPPAIGYMAVFRQIGGCEAPLTMVDYQNLRRR